VNPHRQPLATGLESSLGGRSVTTWFMRRQDSTRGPSGAGKAAAKTLSPERLVVVNGRWGRRPSRQQPPQRHGRVAVTTPGSEVGSSVTSGVHGNQGGPVGGTWHSARRGCATEAASVKPERLGNADWESELRVVASKSGNADGAKAQRFQDSTTGGHGPDTEPEDP
jgi:hypothetical protein